MKCFAVVTLYDEAGNKLNVYKQEETSCRYNPVSDVYEHYFDFHYKQGVAGWRERQVEDEVKELRARYGNQEEATNEGDEDN